MREGSEVCFHQWYVQLWFRNNTNGPLYILLAGYPRVDSVRADDEILLFHGDKEYVCWESLEACIWMFRRGPVTEKGYTRELPDPQNTTGVRRVTHEFLLIPPRSTVYPLFSALPMMVKKGQPLPAHPTAVSLRALVWTDMPDPSVQDQPYVQEATAPILFK
jgi:hypothetical protein